MHASALPRNRGETMAVMILATMAVFALAALATSAGRAQADYFPAIQPAADAAAISGTWTILNCLEVGCGSPVPEILRHVNQQAEKRGIPDTNGVPGDPINDHILAFYVDYDGNCIPLGEECWELHAGPDIIPYGARGLEVAITVLCGEVRFPCLGTPETVITATATAIYVIDGGILPIAANEYWQGSQGQCPYDNCGEPYSFVRDPVEPPPFSEDPPGSDQWVRNFCPNELNDDICQGAYEGFSENFGKAFALMGADATPNYGTMNPRGAVELDYRYDALLDGGTWHALITHNTWMHDVPPIADGAGKAAMEAVLLAGGYDKWPIPRSVHEPPPVYIDQWGYCWDTPPDGCFNYPESYRSEPYDTLQFLSGASAAFLAQTMYDDGNYVDGRYAPGERIIVAVYDSYASSQWGMGGNTADAAVLVGYAGAVIVGYGNDFQAPCSCEPFDWQCFQGCVQGTPNTVYGLIDTSAYLVIDPSDLLDEFLPKEIILLPQLPPTGTLGIRE